MFNMSSIRSNTSRDTKFWKQPGVGEQFARSVFQVDWTKLDVRVLILKISRERASRDVTIHA